MRRALGRRPSKTAWGGSKRRWLALPLLATVLLSCYLVGASTVLRRRAKVSGGGRGTRVLQLSQDQGDCVAWRQTNFCSPFGTRNPGSDKGCLTTVYSGSGFCECANRVTVQRQHCGHFAPFTCADACAKLAWDQDDALALPSNVTCPPKRTSTGVSRQLQSSLAGVDVVLHSRFQSEQTASNLWLQVHKAVQSVAGLGVQLPEPRSGTQDWVAEGLHMPRRDIQRAQRQWQAFLRAAPGYAEDMFSGQGIVILAGGNKYMVPAWVNIHQLRRTGCQLPVEMFFPPREYPTPELETALGRQGVRCRKLPQLPGLAPRAVKILPEAHLAGFTMKIAALVLSSFREVIFLDSDNVAVADPSALLEAPEFTSTGALLWPDYWDSSAAPDLADILGLTGLIPGSFESGQMVFDKRRTWEALMLTTFFNMESGLYYELLTNFIGKGDKETFAYALRATGSNYSLVSTPVGSVGAWGQACGWAQRGCERVFLGNTMTQYAPGPGERLLFLHTNLSPKWGLDIPGHWSEYSQRWQVMETGQAFGEVWPELAGLEQDIYDLLVALRCAPFLPAYVQVLASKERMGQGLPLDVVPSQFHTVNEGVDFAKAYRLSMRGSFQRFTPISWSLWGEYVARNWLRDRANFVSRLFSLRWPYFRLCSFC